MTSLNSRTLKCGTEKKTVQDCSTFLSFSEAIYTSWVWPTYLVFFTEHTKISAYGAANGEKSVSFFQRDFPSKQSVTNSWWFLQVNFLEWRAVFSHVLQNEVFKDCCQIFSLSFCLFFLPPGVKQTIFSEIVIESDSCGWQFHRDWAFGRLFICLSGWMYLTVQVLWADAEVGVWWAGWWLFKYHGQGPLHTCPDHPWLHLLGDLYVGSSAQPWPSCRNHYVGFFISWCFWKSCFSCESMS